MHPHAFDRHNYAEDVGSALAPPQRQRTVPRPSLAVLVRTEGGSCGAHSPYFTQLYFPALQVARCLKHETTDELSKVHRDREMRNVEFNAELLSHLCRSAARVLAAFSSRLPSTPGFVPFERVATLNLRAIGECLILGGELRKLRVQLHDGHRDLTAPCGKWPTRRDEVLAVETRFAR